MNIDPLERDTSSNAPRAFHVRERYLHSEACYLSRAVNLFAAVLIGPRCVSTSSNEFVYILYTSFNKFLFVLHASLWNLPLISSLILHESTEFFIYIFPSVHEFYHSFPSPLLDNTHANIPKTSRSKTSVQVI